MTPGSARRARRDERGATILEFALASGPLLLMLFAILELGVIFATNVNLSNALLSVARQVRLGTVVLPGIAATSSTATSMDLADFKAAVCKNLLLMTTSTCIAQLQVDVRVISSFGSSPPNPVAGTTFSNSSFCFYSGVPGSTVAIRAFLLWPVDTPLLLPSLANVTSIASASGTSRGSFFVLLANEAFINEPNSVATNNSSGC